MNFERERECEVKSVEILEKNLKNEECSTAREIPQPNPEHCENVMSTRAEAEENRDTVIAVNWVHSKVVAGLVHIAMSSGGASVLTACSHRIKFKNAVSGTTLQTSQSGSRPWCKSCADILPVSAREWIWSQVRQSSM